MAATNPCAKKVTPETAYEVWQSYDGTWTYFVLKKYQPPEKEAHNSYARWYCLVKTPINPNGEYGDVYVSDEAFEQISAMVKGNRVCDEQPAVRQHSHCIRQVVMGFALKDIADGEGGWDYSFLPPHKWRHFLFTWHKK